MTATEHSAQLELLPARTPDVHYEVVGLVDVAGYQAARPAAELVELIARVGRLLQPLVVVAQADGRYRIVDGRRRAKAVSLLEGEGRWPSPATVPALIVAAADSCGGVVRGGLTLALHASRSPSPASELAAIETILATGADERATIREIAAQTGMPIQTVKRRLRLRALSPALRAAFERGQLAASVAERAARLTAEQQETLEQILAAGGRVTLSDVQDTTRRRSIDAVATLPDGVFEDRHTPWQLTVRGHLQAALEAIPPSERESQLAHTITNAGAQAHKPSAAVGHRPTGATSERASPADRDPSDRLLHELAHVARYLHQHGIGDGACAVTDAIRKLTPTPQENA